MSDLASQPDPEELAELCALADGTLPADRRPGVESRIAASPELQALLERQRRAVLATRALDTDEPSPSLQAAVESQRGSVASRRRSRRLMPRFALAGAIVAALVIGALVLNEGPGAPTVADAARLATESPTEPAPPGIGKAGTRLAIAVGGVTFPDLARAYGWRALGVRHGTINGRDATVVYYGKGSRRLAYAIVAGDGLARPSGGVTNVRRAVPYQALQLNGRLVVTWRRGGHTCVLIGDASRAELLKLASWPLSPSR